MADIMGRKAASVGILREGGREGGRRGRGEKRRLGSGTYS